MTAPWTACLVCAAWLSPAGPPPLTLERALLTALSGNPALLASGSAVREATGDLLAAGAPFDLRFLAFVSGGREENSSFLLAGGARTDLSQRSAATGVTARKLLRWGPAVSAEVSLEQADARAPESGAARTLSVNGGALVPLLNGRGGGMDREFERATRADRDGRVSDFRHAASDVALRAAAAYWAYVGAQERLAVLVATERRAAQLVDEIRALIEADERPPADADLLQANLASKRAQRLLAEQRVLEARHELAATMGLSAEEAEALGAAVTAFPSQSGTPDRLAVRVLAGSAGRRDDLAAARSRLQATDLLRQGAQDALRPRLDLELSLDYEGASGAVGRPLEARGSRAWAATVRLQFEPVRLSSLDRARMVRADAVHARESVAVDALERAIASGVTVAAHAVERHTQELESVAEAVRLSTAAVATEKKKFQLGMATLFDAILAEDTLSGALLQQIDARQRYAQALARLRFEAADLVRWTPAGPAVDTALLLDVGAGN